MDYSLQGKGACLTVTAAINSDLDPRRETSDGPDYPVSYALNRDISVLAERIGLDYVFSMSKWRGFGGVTEFWDHTLESFTMMTALAAHTTRLSLIATVYPLLFNPGLMAKMAATFTDIAGGRLGLNLITGSSLSEYQQMGVVPETYADRRYEYVAEWTAVLKRLWTEDRVTHHGGFLHLDDCVSSPKPSEPPVLVCAASSDEGLRYTARECDYSFIAGATLEDARRVSLQAKRFADEAGRTIKTATAVMVIQGESRDAAEAEFQRLLEGADFDAIDNITTQLVDQKREFARTRAERMKTDASRVSFGARPLIGSAADIAQSISDLADNAAMDSILLIFPDYLHGLAQFANNVMPLLAHQFSVGTPDELAEGIHEDR
jgi:pyrimidine oxygenase